MADDTPAWQKLASSGVWNENYVKKRQQEVNPEELPIAVRDANGNLDRDNTLRVMVNNNLDKNAEGLDKEYGSSMSARSKVKK